MNSFYKKINFVFIERCLRIIFQYLVFIYIATNLESSIFSKLIFLLTIISVFQTVFLSDLSNIFQNFIGQKRYSTTQILRINFIFCLTNFILLLTFLFFYFGSYFEKNSEILLISFLFIFSSLQITPMSIMRFNQAMYTETTILAISFYVGSILKIMAVYNNLPFLYLLIIFSIEGILSLLIATSVFINKKFDLTIKNLNNDISFISVFKKNFKYFVASALTILYMKTDIIMLEFFEEMNEISKYAFSVRLMEGILSIVGILNYYLLSKFIADKRKFLTKIDSKNVLRAYLIFALGFILTSYFMSYIFSQEIAIKDAFRYSLILGPAIFLALIGALYSFKEIAKQSYNIMLFRNFSGFVTNIILNIYLIPEMGALGAAVATLISYFIAVALPFTFSKSYTEFYKQLFLRSF